MYNFHLKQSIICIFSRPPTCISDLLEYPGLSTMHHYFYNYPWLTVCPFNQVTLLIEWFTLPVCLRLLWVLLQNMKYTKSRGLQGPNIFVALSCAGFLSYFFVLKLHSPSFSLSTHLASAKPPLHHYGSELNRVFEQNTKTNAEIIVINL